MKDLVQFQIQFTHYIIVDFIVSSIDEGINFIKISNKKKQNYIIVIFATHYGVIEKCKCYKVQNLLYGIYISIFICL